jgi:hypothetical protein
LHILFLTDNFPPEVNAPASRTFEHCREWVKAGRRVTVLTCAPNFPGGQVFEGYRNRLWQSEEMEGIRVIRVWTYITANEGFVKRIPFVFELRDIWPEPIKAVGAMGDSPVIRLLERIEMFLYGQAARIVSVTESFKRTLENGFKRVILVTSDYHMLRSWVLLKLLLPGSGIELQRVAVPSVGVASPLGGPRQIAAEMVKLWGNLGDLGDLGFYAATGMRPADWPPAEKLLRFITSRKWARQQR